MKAADYPKRGDIVWLEFNPQMGHEQAGRRPALAISHDAYNKKTGLAVFCPISTREKGYPFEVKIPHGLKISGIILSDQVKNLDWSARKSTFICRLPRPVFDEVLSKLNAVFA